MKLYIILLTIIFSSCQSNGQNKSENHDFPVKKSEKEWKSELSEQEYYVLRQAGTERAYSSELLNIKTAGTFVCAACGNELYETKHKFKSGTGWPSFDRAIEGSISYDSDQKLGYTRRELLCAACGGHLGHLFDDGPSETTGKRHCINGVALDFNPKKDSDEE